MSQDPFKDRLKLSPAERRELLDRLDDNSRAEGEKVTYKGKNARQAPRYEYRKPNLPVAIERPDGGSTKLLVCGRNLSASGLSFLSGGYMNSGTRCKLLLQKIDGDRMVLGGQVVNSRLIQGSLHEVSLNFHHEIEVAELIRPEELTECTGGPTAPETMPTPPDAAADGAMMNNYIEQAHQCAERLNQAIADESVDAIRTLCEQLQEDASRASPELSLAATSLLKAIDSGGTLADYKTQIQDLSDLCGDATDGPEEGS